MLTARPPQYAVVTYVRGALGRFVEGMRRELYPEHAHLAAHITILPPRHLAGGEAEAITALQAAISRISGFEVFLGEVETFFPRTATVFLRVDRFAHKIRDLHDVLTTGALNTTEQWPYMPHMTIVKMPQLEQTQAALTRSKDRWSDYTGPRVVPIEELTFVREGENNQWIDLASFSLTVPVK